MSDSPGRSSRALASARVGVQALRTNPMRTLLATLGVIIGVAALVAVLSLGDGMESYVRSQVSRTTSVQNVLVIPVTADTVDGILVARARPRLVGLGDVADAERSLPRRIEGEARARVTAGRHLLGLRQSLRRRRQIGSPR